MTEKNGELPPAFIESEKKRHEEMFDMLSEREKELLLEIARIKIRIKKAKEAGQPVEELDAALEEKDEELWDLRDEKTEHEDLMKRADEEEE